MLVVRYVCAPCCRHQAPLAHSHSNANNSSSIALIHGSCRCTASTACHHEEYGEPLCFAPQHVHRRPRWLRARSPKHKDCTSQSQRHAPMHTIERGRMERTANHCRRTQQAREQEGKEETPPRSLVPWLLSVRVLNWQGWVRMPAGALYLIGFVAIRATLLDCPLDSLFTS